jgi:5-formyltetrahydrofolate cyclo-ligase
MGVCFVEASDKVALRRRILERRNAVSFEERVRLSVKVLENLYSLREYVEAGVVFFYVNFRSEVETVSGIRRALSDGKLVAVPYCVLEERRLNFVEIKSVERDLVEDAYGILEPKPSLRHTRRVPVERADVVLFPGSVFDRHGGRMGYGAGYYDKTFGRVSKPLFVALAFDFQVLPPGEFVPMAEHDVFVGKIVTERGVYDCSRK